MACSGSPRPGSRSSYDASAIPPSRGPVRNHPLAPDGPPLRADAHAGVGTSVDEPRAPAGGQPGEIAIRIARAAADLGIPTVGVFSEDDAGCLHVRHVDAARPLSARGPRAYLDVEQLIA